MSKTAATSITSPQTTTPPLPSRSLELKPTPKIVAQPEAAKEALKQSKQTSANTSSAEVAVAMLQRNKAFTLTDVLQAWENFKHTYQPKIGTPSPEPIFNLVQIHIEGQTVVVGLGNKAFEGLLNKIKPDLLLFWRKELQNDSLQIRILITEVAEQIPAQTALTDSQKFQVLASKYPLLHQLKEKLGLDFDFNH